MPDLPPPPQSLPYATPFPAAPPHSRAGIASFILGVLSIVGLFLSLNVRKSAPAAPGSAPAMDSRATATLLFALFLVLPLIGLALGIVGVTRRNRKHGLAIAGIVLNAIVLLLIAAAVTWALLSIG